MDYTITLDDKFEAALAQDASDSSVSPEDFMKSVVESRLTETANRLVQADKDARLAALDSAADTDTKVDILSKINIQPVKLPPVGVIQ